MGDVSLWGIGVDEHAAASVLEFGPLKVWGNVLRVADDIRVHCFFVICTRADVLQELLKGLLDGLHNVGLECLKVLLHRYEVLSAVVFFENLFVEKMLNPSMKDIRVMLGVDLATSRVVCSRMLSEQLDTVLRTVLGSIYGFGYFTSPRADFAVLALDFLVQSCKDRKNLSIKTFAGFQVRVRQCL